MHENKKAKRKEWKTKNSKGKENIIINKNKCSHFLSGIPLDSGREQQQVQNKQTNKQKQRTTTTKLKSIKCKTQLYMMYSLPLKFS